MHCFFFLPLQFFPNFELVFSFLLIFIFQILFSLSFAFPFLGVPQRMRQANSTINFNSLLLILKPLEVANRKKVLKYYLLIIIQYYFIVIWKASIIFQILFIIIRQTKVLLETKIFKVSHAKQNVYPLSYSFFKIDKFKVLLLFKMLIVGFFFTLKIIFEKKKLNECE